MHFILNKSIVLMPVNYIIGVMVSLLASSAVYRGFELWSGKNKNYKIGTAASKLSSIKE